MKLLIPLSEQGEPLFRQIYAGLRGGILSGALRRGERIPSTRDLADQLGVSRTTVVLAYEQLSAEGFTTGQGGSGTYVSESLRAADGRTSTSTANFRLSLFGGAAEEAASTVDFPARAIGKAIRYDFAYGKSDVEFFRLRPGAVCFSATRARLRSATLTMVRQKEISLCAMPSARMCAGRVPWFAILRR